jgi:hypothetical protein
MKQKIPWQCPCCGYSTFRKDHMKLHLYKSKPCPKALADVEFTEEVKQYILTNKVYRAKTSNQTPGQSSSQQTINNINFVNNFTNNIKIIDKLETYTEFRDIETKGLDDMLEDKYKTIIRRMDRDKPGIMYHQQDFKKVIDEVSTISDVEHFNMFIDPVNDKLNIYKVQEWESHLFDEGISIVIGTIQDYLYNNYEKYLIRKIKNDSSLFARQEAKELLTEYYKFIKCFNLDPYVKYNDDSDIFGTNIETNEVKYEFIDFYNKLEVPLSFSKNIKKEITNIIKKNSRYNVCELNKLVASLIHIDKEFETKLITKHASLNV